MKYSKLTPVLALLIFVISLAFAQGNIESKIEAIENEMSRFRQKQYDVISQTNFEKAQKALSEAKKKLQEGKKISDIEKKLVEAARYLRLVNDLGQQGEIVFRSVLEARNDALEAQAPEFAPEEFKKSEEILREASKRLEKGDLNGAKDRAFKAEEAFRQAELIAIKENVVGPVRDLLQQAKDQKVGELAPYTLNEAQNLYEQVLVILNGDRYAKKDASEKAQEAEYQVKHAMYLSNIIKKLRKDDKNWEMLIRDFEDRMDHIAAELGFQGRYDSGFSDTEKNIILAIQNLKEENQSLKEELKNLQEENASLTEKIQKYERTVVTELQKKKEWEEKLKKIEQLFTPDEAQVLLSGDEMIIRLYGLTFQSAKAVILPEHFKLLTKVMRALREFPHKKIIVAGHTDSQGNDAYNLTLSENRAAAVRAYLEANMALPPGQIESIGYGESRPIASNETVEGRRQNRRIEIIIKLESQTK